MLAELALSNINWLVSVYKKIHLKPRSGVIDMAEQEVGQKKKLVRRLATLSSIRKEIVRVYEEARKAGADPGKVQFYRALTFILSSAADVLRNEKLDDIEVRLDKLEQKAGDEP